MAVNVSELYPLHGQRTDNLLSLAYGNVVDRYTVEHRPSVYDQAPIAAQEIFAARTSSSSFFDLAPASTQAIAPGAITAPAGAAIIDDMLSLAGRRENNEDAGRPPPASIRQPLPLLPSTREPSVPATPVPVQAGSTRPAVLMPRVWRLMGEDDAGTPQCRKCKTRFEKRGNLQRHVLHVHFKHKPFECRVCKVAFGYKSHLLRHMGTVHREDEAPSTDA